MQISIFPYGPPSAKPPLVLGLLDVNLQLPIRGMFVCDVITTSVGIADGKYQLLEFNANYQVGSIVDLDLGGDWMFVGQVLRIGIWRGSVHLRFVGGTYRFGMFPVIPNSFSAAPWDLVYQTLLTATSPGLLLNNTGVPSAYDAALTAALSLEPLTVTLSGSRRSSALMNVLVGMQNQNITSNIVAFYATAAGPVAGQLAQNLGAQTVLNWRVLPKSKSLTPGLNTGTGLVQGGAPGIAVVYDYTLATAPPSLSFPFMTAPLSALAPPGASYAVDVQGISGTFTLAQANLAAGTLPQPVVWSTATLRDISPETGLESYGVEYPVLLPGNWYNSPVASSAVGTVANLNGAAILPLPQNILPPNPSTPAWMQIPTKVIQALDVEYRFHDNQLQMTVRTRSALNEGGGVAAYITQLGVI